MNSVELRDQVIGRLRQDLIGPKSENEVLEGRRVRPSDVYLTGILWIPSSRMGPEDDDASGGEDEEDDTTPVPSLVGQQRPCSMGVSFCLRSNNSNPAVDVGISFGTYDFERVADGLDGIAPTQLRWTRRAHQFRLSGLSVPAVGVQEHSIPLDKEGADIRLHIRSKKSRFGILVTLTLINRSSAVDSDRNSSESLALFQCAMQVRASGGSVLAPKPQRPTANDDDEKVGRLLYRDAPEFASGHNCSASWESINNIATVVHTEWIPETTVTAYSENGASVFDTLIREEVFTADRLACASDAEVIDYLSRLPTAYRDWITAQKSRLGSLEDDLLPIAEKNIGTCDAVCARIESGINSLRLDRTLLAAFKLANAAMALQHGWKSRERGKPLSWRPFQLGFILLCANSTCKKDAPDREIFDLLWFPTGGGKTEAYLALIAMLAFYRRGAALEPDLGAGNAALMRYTLRLLTAQQFERASALILACELIRQGRHPKTPYPFPKGNKPISIGLWVGGDATPNHFAGERGALATRGGRDGTTAEQLSLCPCCHERVRWDYNEERESVRPYCESVTCALGATFGLWPVFTVDDDVYRERPTLLVGTIDKFAMLTTKREVAELFGFGTTHSSDLIIQDELHLISGPLGTIAGIYETAFDWLLMKDRCRAKVIGSTATIRRASEQIRSLFNRECCQFPPPGLDYDDSGFAIRDTEKPPRKYLGVTTAGRSAKFAIQAVAGSLLQATGSRQDLADRERDGYATLLAYFNSLRELGGAIVQMLDDVPDSMKLYASRRQENVRTTYPPKELTSRVSQKEIIEILSDLKIPAGQPGSIDTVLATNMVSVGVDVSRLGMMIINGQPKTRAEYIQATSRVGRSSFPGLIVAVLNAAKPRDRSHFETFFGWHKTLYKDVEATSVTPFASRARDRALHAALVSMIRHRNIDMQKGPKLAKAPTALLKEVIREIESRVKAVDSRELSACEREINELLSDWEARHPTFYTNRRAPNKSLLISADLNVQRLATGRLPSGAWPTMNNMRSVEASTRFRMAEALAPRPVASENPTDGSTTTMRWRSPT
jgi:superfamily II DNA or RNA helicase